VTASRQPEQTETADVDEPAEVNEPAEADEPAASGRTFAPDFITELFRNPLDPGYAAAAARRKERGQPSAASRFSGGAARTVVLVAAGFLLAIAYHQTIAAHPQATQIRNNLVNDVKARQAETDAMQRQADQLRDQVSRQREQALAGTDTTNLRNLEAQAGVVKVHGNGVVVQLTDAPDQIDPVTGKASQNLGKVQDRDLQAVCNQLWHDGAEAIAINGERLTATSTIRAAGETILVDFRPIMSPYEVSAIGPSDLDRRFSDSSTGELFRELVTDYHMQVSVKRQDDLTLPAAADPQLHFAQPVPGPSASSASPGQPQSPVPSSSGGR
jgi:uncharacterized protein YlxW (UPF0749 family)